jgi:hypothetical protein
MLLEWFLSQYFKIGDCEVDNGLTLFREVIAVNFQHHAKHIVAFRPVARYWPQHIRNTKQWSNWEAVFCTRSLR